MSVYNLYKKYSDTDGDWLMGRTKRWSEDMRARFSEGTFERITAVLKGTEDRTEFVRTAVENEIRRREGKSGVDGGLEPSPITRKELRKRR